MPVFKAAMKIARQNMGLIIMYIMITALVLGMTIKNSTAADTEGFRTSSMTISVADEDQSVLSHALTDWLASVHTLKFCENDPELLLEELYYRQSDYVLRIPAGFGVSPQNTPLQVTEVPGSYTGFYLNSQIEHYLRLVSLYKAAGYAVEEAVSLARDTEAPTVTILQQEQDSQISMGAFFQFIPYGALCMMSYVIGSVLCAFLTPELRKRTGASAFTHRQTEWELLAAVFVFGILLYGVFLIMGSAFYKGAFWTTPNLHYYLANMAIMILVCMSIAYVIAMVSSSQESLPGIVNSVSLGMSFLCGVFVPLDLLGNGVKKAAQFLPFYWYEQGNILITEFPSLASSQLKSFWICLGIQAVFAVFLISLGAAIHKKRS